MPRLSAILLKWYRANGRTLPWRGHPDAYAVWVSEIMLQQTRVDTVIPYFEKWMRLFPTINNLAKASEREVLNAWEGLGYYSRARNLHKAAQIVMEKHNGELPRDLIELRALPGIGRYTVGAIASMAFGMDEPTLDGNLRRVFARLFNVTEAADSPAGEKRLWSLAAQNLPNGEVGDYNQALMDLGATICLPKNPRCEICPLRNMCVAFELGLQEKRPVLKPKKSIPHRVLVAAVITPINNQRRAILAKRPSKGLLGGMWEFPNGEVGGDPAKELVNVLKTGYGLKVRKKEALGIIRHAYSHFKVTVYAYRCESSSIQKEKGLKWVRINDLENYPMGKVDRQIARMLNDVRKRAKANGRNATQAKGTA